MDCYAEYIGTYEDMPKVRIPLMSCAVEAGFPSPAEDYMEGVLDLNARYVRNPPATYFLKAHGDSMLGAGIHSGDLLIVDRSYRARDGKIVIVSLNGEMLVKRLVRRNGQCLLTSANPDYPTFDISSYEEVAIWGVVIAHIHDDL